MKAGYDQRPTAGCGWYAAQAQCLLPTPVAVCYYHVWVQRYSRHATAHLAAPAAAAAAAAALSRLPRRASLVFAARGTSAARSGRLRARSSSTAALALLLLLGPCCIFLLSHTGGGLRSRGQQSHAADSARTCMPYRLFHFPGFVRLARQHLCFARTHTTARPCRVQRRVQRTQARATGAHRQWALCLGCLEVRGCPCEASVALLLLGVATNDKSGTFLDKPHDQRLVLQAGDKQHLG